jgi:hypothetical protein
MTMPVPVPMPMLMTMLMPVPVPMPVPMLMPMPMPMQRLPRAPQLALVRQTHSTPLQQHCWGTSQSHLEPHL